MRFPLSRAPFGNYPTLSAAQTQSIEFLVQQTLDETLAEYETHRHHHRRLLPRSQYKVVKRVENLICYRHRSSGVQPEKSEAGTPLWPSPNSSSSTSDSCSEVDPSEASLATSSRSPKLLTIGSMAGTLDDVMYGLLATDATSTFIRASYTNEELVDSELLHCIEVPTVDNPFQFCGIKWHVLELTKITTKRDFVFIEASGVLVRPNGDRLGYYVTHSVDLPGLGALSEKHQVLRARVASCNLFQQLSNNTVDVYMTGLVDLSGYIPCAVATASTVSTFLKLALAVECSLSKKLEYLLEQQQFKRANGGLSHAVNTTSTLTVTSGKRLKATGSTEPCAVCATALHRFRSTAYCELCSEAVCSRCRVTKRLSYRVARPKELKQKNTIFCTACVAKGSIYSAADVARVELNAQSALRTKTSSSKGDEVAGNQLHRFLSSPTLSSYTTASSSSLAHSRLQTPLEEEEGQDQDEDELELYARRRSLNMDDLDLPGRKRTLSCCPPGLDDWNEQLDESEFTGSYSSSSDYLDSDYLDSDYLVNDWYEHEAGRRKTQPSDAFSDLPECESVNPLASSMPLKKPTTTMTTTTTSSLSSMETEERRQRDLIRRMEELRRNAESVYQLTRRNAQTMRFGGRDMEVATYLHHDSRVGHRPGGTAPFQLEGEPCYN
uniref:FYVE-type domain-containing protein n=1 Tax=Peronospora matthiolae TaxID=2874970 RepID=A0AAV1T9J8_9STRA